MQKRCVNRIACISLAGACVFLAVAGGDDVLAATTHAEMAHSAGNVAGMHEEGHPSGGGLPQLDATTFVSQLFWLLVSFTIMYMIFSRRSLPEISGVLENRKNHIQGDLETAERLKGEAQKAQQTYEASLQNARDMASRAMHDAQEAIKANANKQTEAFRKKLDNEINAMDKRLASAKQSAMDDMTTVAAEIASEAAKRIVGINPDIEDAKTVVKSLNGHNAKAA